MLHALQLLRVLGDESTRHVYPTLGNRMSPKEWEEREKPCLQEAATRRKEIILSVPSAARFHADLDRAIRARFPIHLPAY